MEASLMMFLDCPAYLDARRTRRCGLPAEVQDRYLARSTDGPLDCARIRCPEGHWFNGPIEFLTWKWSKAPATRATDRDTDAYICGPGTGQSRAGYGQTD